jgi:hypothetical protein
MRSANVLIRRTYSQTEVAVAIAASGAPDSQFTVNAADLFEAGRAALSDFELARRVQDTRAHIKVVETPFSVQELAGAWQWIWDNWGSPDRLEAAYAAAYSLIENGAVR